MILRIMEHPSNPEESGWIHEVKITRLFTRNIQGRMTFCYYPASGGVVERYCDEVKDWDVIQEGNGNKKKSQIRL